MRKGKCVSGFEAVQRAFEEIFDDPQERGGGVCVQVAGETVVDLRAGVADLEGSKPWNHDTLVNSYCAIKPMVAVAVLMLVEEGKLEVDAPVARCWPEFAQSGKRRSLCVRCCPILLVCPRYDRLAERPSCTTGKQ